MNYNNKGKSALLQNSLDPQLIRPGMPNPRQANTTFNSYAASTPRPQAPVLTKNQPTAISNNVINPRPKPRSGVFANLANDAFNTVRYGVFGSPSQSVFGNFNRNYSGAIFGTRTPLAQQKPNNMEYNNINKKAFSNVGNIKGVMGESVKGTFNRSIGKSPLKQSIDPMTGEYLDPAIDLSTDNTVVPPPIGVQTQITPNYDINNY
jgi:hypothetical protein